MAKYILGCMNLKGMSFRESLSPTLPAFNTETTAGTLSLSRSANLAKSPNPVTEENVIPKSYCYSISTESISTLP